jgi:hypothetical protein
LRSGIEKGNLTSGKCKISGFLAVEENFEKAFSLAGIRKKFRD